MPAILTSLPTIQTLAPDTFFFPPKGHVPPVLSDHDMIEHLRSEHLGRCARCTNPGGGDTDSHGIKACPPLVLSTEKLQHEIHGHYVCLTFQPLDAGLFAMSLSSAELTSGGF